MFERHHWNRTRLIETLPSFFFLYTPPYYIKASTMAKKSLSNYLQILLEIKTFAIIVWRDFTTKRVMSAASNLTYSTLLATVPILAVVFAIARGFGYSIHIEEWFRSLLEAQPEACETIIGFVNSYLKNTQKGLFLGIGLLFLFWTVLMLIQNIEQTFNDIWQVKKQRSLFRTFTDYIALLFLVPIFIVVSSGFSIWITALNRNITDFVVISTMVKYLLELSPYLFSSAVFVALYTFMPNANVKLKSALWPGIFAGISFQLFQVIYINSQIWISKYNAIYGSFAILPFFMLWMQISWSICLIGAELSYMNQNREDFTSHSSTEQISHDAWIKISAVVMSIICKRFHNGESALTALQLKEQTGITMRLLTEILYTLEKIHFVSIILGDEKGEEPHYQPAESLSKLTFGELLKRLNADGITPPTAPVQNSEAWQRIEQLREQFFADSNNVELKDV